MQKIAGFVVLAISLWQFWMTKRALTYFQKQGNESTSPFLMLSFWSSLSFALLFLGFAFALIFDLFPY
ncbi:hypothetical protein JZO70_13115 [Enterococcus sp. 669A]|uniref:Uncharacterized protein n=1 Tax=Candidatus Enterococcus moelleringii TaxID=2815325 RepID=A0ABS3LDE1_9ENTE|nr:hypothetical protein [Enterococcus sp. 669A]MBO1307110.1 hypothetical protein [Enterococcus sp. 669A]